MKHCTDPMEQWPAAPADVSTDRIDDFLTHAEECPYHTEILNEGFEKELRSVFRLARGLDNEGRILRGAELRNAIADHERRAKEWKTVGSAESPFGLISIYNGGKLVAGSGAFRNHTYHQARHDLDPQAGLQIRARCASNKDEDVLLGFYPLGGVRHDGEELLLPLDNGHTAGIKVEQIGDKSFEVYFRCVENGVIKKAHQEALNQERTTIPSNVYVLDEPLDNECTDEVKLLILEIRYLAKQQRYKEALDLARKATEIAPDYWRAQINLGSMLAMTGKMDEGDKIFHQVSRDHPNNPKAVAAGLHCCASVKEIRCGYNLSADSRLEVVRLYEEALRLASLSANTRVCLLISSMSDKDRKRLDDSILCEGVFDALKFEITERGTERVQKFLHALPTRLRNLLFPIGQSYAEGHGC
jgi:tetratricopeptide (TPR) repeat protein